MCATPADRTVGKAELLKWEGVVADVDDLTAGNKSDRPRRHQEVGFEKPAVRDNRQNRQARVGALADPCL